MNLLVELGTDPMRTPKILDKIIEVRRRLIDDFANAPKVSSRLGAFAYSASDNEAERRDAVTARKSDADDDVAEAEKISR
jgi:hypothetical protein